MTFKDLNDPRGLVGSAWQSFCRSPFVKCRHNILRQRLNSHKRFTVGSSKVRIMEAGGVRARSRKLSDHEQENEKITTLPFSYKLYQIIISNTIYSVHLTVPTPKSSLRYYE